jgi:hypothetical protein
VEFGALSQFERTADGSYTKNTKLTKGHKENQNSLRRIACPLAAPRFASRRLASPPTGETVDTWPVPFVNFVLFVPLCAEGAEGADRQARRVVVSSPRRFSATRNRIERKEA